MKQGIEVVRRGDAGNEKTKRDTTLSPDFAYAIKLEGEPDRHGMVGSINAVVDWRPRKIVLSYDFFSLQQGANFFIDDHLRTFNNQIAKGGRDMREFSIKDPAIVEKRTRYLEQLNEEFGDVKSELLSRIPAARFVVIASQKDASRSGRDDDGVMRYEGRTDFQLRFVNVHAASQRMTTPSYGRTTTRDTYLPGESITISAGTILHENGGYNKKPLGYDNALQEIDERGTKAFRDTLRDLAEKENSQATQDMLARYRFLEKEIALCDGVVAVSIPVILSPINMPPEERDGALRRASSDLPTLRATYQPRHSSVQLEEEIGTQGTRTWYEAIGVDINADVIPFHATIGLSGMESAEGIRTKKQDAEAKEIRLKNAQDASRAASAAEESAVAARAAAEVYRQERQRRIQEELTPEVKAQLLREAGACTAMIRIASTFPATSTEQTKFVHQVLEAPSADAEAEAIAQGKLGLEVRERLAFLTKRVEQFATRKKISEELPLLWRNILEKTEAYKAVDDLIAGNRDAQAAIDLDATTHEGIARFVRESYLRDPWNTSPKEILQKHVESLLE